MTILLADSSALMILLSILVMTTSESLLGYAAKIELIRNRPLVPYDVRQVYQHIQWHFYLHRQA